MKNFLVFVLLICLIPMSVSAEQLYRAKSLYRDIYVVKTDNILCLKFSIPRKQDTSQSCKDLGKPDELVFNYSKLAMSGILVNSKPESILIVGLGGGSIPTALHDLYPEANITTVEIDPAVADVARKYFEFVESDKNKVVIRDARLYIKREAIKKQQYDMVYLDAFGSDYIPEHLTTVEFLQEVKEVLSPRGVVVANTFSSSRLSDHELSTYAATFGDFYTLRTDMSSNRVILAGIDSDMMRIENIEKNVALLEQKLKKYRVDAQQLFSIIDTVPAWNKVARPLTDQYSPANILNSR